MYKLILENKNGDRLTFNELGGAFTITEIQGLNPPNATINTTTSAYIDGAVYNSSKAEMRQFQIAFAIEREAAKNRIEVYKVLKSKQFVKVYYTSQYRDVTIEGYVSAIGIAYFNMKQIVTVSILCPYPFWQDAQAVISELSSVVGVFHFPFASLETPELVFGYIDPFASVEVVNNGDVATGLIIELYASAAISNPRIYDYLTGDYFALDFDMEEADLITIDTRAGKKSVTLLRNGATSNIFNSISQGSTWLQLDFGGGVYAYGVESGEQTNLVVTIRHRDVYEGV